MSAETQARLFSLLGGVGVGVLVLALARRASSEQPTLLLVVLGVLAVLVGVLGFRRASRQR
ncbi:hypothetical protein [Nocardioides litoris]|uniref:hypothetical protein n=1 Tax=Nocardioides litoris TaxID=1926648 RepID=UPI00111CFFB7|nr:hypothetical protein [Nocardioides litoris]